VGRCEVAPIIEESQGKWMGNGDEIYWQLTKPEAERVCTILGPIASAQEFYRDLRVAMQGNEPYTMTLDVNTAVFLANILTQTDPTGTATVKLNAKITFYEAITYSTVTWQSSA
jgi:hypothetical protein